MPAHARLQVFMSRSFFAMAMLCAAAAPAQTTAPDEQWSRPPESLSTPPPANTTPPNPGTVPGAPERKPMYVPPEAQPMVSDRPRVVEAPNRTSMFGAPALGQWKRGQSLVLGFPLLSLRVNIGVLDRLDVGVGFDSFYGAMNEPRIQAKYQLAGNDSWALAASLEAGVAFFNQRAARENKGPRWITGHRNWNVAPGIVFSFQGSHPRAARIFFDARYLLAFDTEPFASDPLNGVPSSLVLGHNVVLRGGAEIPLSEKTSFICGAGFDVHGRAEDSRAMPAISLGLVTGL